MKHPYAASRLPRSSVLGAACTLLAVACSSGTEEREPTPEGFPETGQIRLQLTRTNDCADLLGKIQDNVIAQLGERAKQLRVAPDYGFGPGIGMGTGGVTPDGNLGSDPRPGPPSSPNPGVPVDDGAPVNNGDADAPSGGNVDPSNDGAETPPTAPQSPAEGEGGGFSNTTVQVKDVDEADIVKTDGDLLYLLHGATLFVLNAWPAASTEIIGDALIEGDPIEMFVRDGKAIVFSRVYRDLALEASTEPVTPDYYRNYYSTNYTKLTVFDVTGATPSVTRESYLEGDYLSARRHDGIVRAVVQNGFKVPPLGSPSIEYNDPFGERYPQVDIDQQVDAWLARTTRSIQNTDLGDWLPREFAAVSGRPVLQAPRCGDYYAPDAGLTESGVTSVVSLDLDNVAAALGGATILGNAERVYSNEDVVLVTQSDYRFMWSAGSHEQTIIHRFDIDGANTAYTASGAVAGTIHDQFSLDERNGVIAVSTTENNFGGVAVPTEPPVGMTPQGVPVDEDAAIAPAPLPAPPTGPVNRIVTLETDGTSLEQIGETENFGQTERIFATRFMGDRAYVVTFLQRDPLFVVDMADPRNPHVVGELHIPGFSNFMFPLGADHLFAIGRDATDDGSVQGLALSIFDVSNPAAPALAHRYLFEDLGDSPANIDHRAISFHADRDVVAFPHRSWQTGESTLEVFQISAADGFERLGGMGMPDELDIDECLTRIGYDPAYIAELKPQLENDPNWQREVLASCSYGREFRRGLFRDDVVYGISTSGVYAYNLDALGDGMIGQVSLPDPVYNNNGGGTVPGVNPSGPAPAAPPGMEPPAPSMPAGMAAMGGGSEGTPVDPKTPPGMTPASDDDTAAEEAAQ